jgi:hypothetical protein
MAIPSSPSASKEMPHPQTSNQGEARERNEQLENVHGFTSGVLPIHSSMARM